MTIRREKKFLKISKIQCRVLHSGLSLLCLLKNNPLTFVGFHGQPIILILTSHLANSVVTCVYDEIVDESVTISEKLARRRVKKVILKNGELVIYLK